MQWYSQQSETARLSPEKCHLTHTYIFKSQKKRRSLSEMQTRFIVTQRVSTVIYSYHVYMITYRAWWYVRLCVWGCVRVGSSSSLALWWRDGFPFRDVSPRIWLLHLYELEFSACGCVRECFVIDDEPLHRDSCLYIIFSFTLKKLFFYFHCFYYL